ncbi:MAG: 1-acyl-sn-glycerol-3-phosphate acyltransferase [Clostridia bacterium]|nr:1-acyl-sn-glycerol-3-phosphate acyltransferase [Clostridia bacterium]
MSGKKVKPIKFVGPLAKLASTLPFLIGKGKEVDKLMEKDYYGESVELGYRCAKEWCKTVCDRLKVNIIVHNPENLPEGGGHVYVCNHQGMFDIVSLLVITKEPTGAIAKKEFEKFPILGPWVRRLHGVFIDRTNARTAVDSIKYGVANIKNGVSMMIFPEGTRSRDGVLQEFHKGSFKLATGAKADIIPIAFIGSNEVVEAEGEFKENVDIHIYVHEAIKTSDMSREELVALPKMVEDIIRHTLEENTKTE